MKQYLEKLIEGKDLTREETHEIMLNIVEEKYSEHQISALLMGIQMHGATVDELLGLRDGLLETGKPVELNAYNTLDIVGTGGDGKNTFNISTCSAFVIAGAGYKVSKHGNGAATSVSGASTVLQNHGVKFSADPDVHYRSLDEAGICYFHAPLFAGAESSDLLQPSRSVSQSRPAKKLPARHHHTGSNATIYKHPSKNR